MSKRKACLKSKFISESAGQLYGFRVKKEAVSRPPALSAVLFGLLIIPDSFSSFWSPGWKVLGSLASLCSITCLGIEGGRVTHHHPNILHPPTQSASSPGQCSWGQQGRGKGPLQCCGTCPFNPPTQVWECLNKKRHRGWLECFE